MERIVGFLVRAACYLEESNSFWLEWQVTMERAVEFLARAAGYYRE
jgi:hypothetical protein